MKRWLVLLVLFVCVLWATTQGVRRRPIVVAADVGSSSSTHKTSSSPTHASALINVTTGNLIVVAVGWGTNPVDITSVTDTAGNTYISAVGPVSLPTSPFRTQIFYAKNVTGGDLTVTVTYSADVTSSRLGLHEYSGASLTAPLDVTSSNTGASGNPDSGSAITTAANEIIFGWSLSSGGTTAGAGFTQRELIGSEATEDKSVTSIGSYSATFNSASGDWAALMATFK